MLLLAVIGGLVALAVVVWVVHWATAAPLKAKNKVLEDLLAEARQAGARARQDVEKAEFQGRKADWNKCVADVDLDTAIRRARDAEKRAQDAMKALEDLRTRKGLAARQQEALIESLKSQNKQMATDLCNARQEANRLKANQAAAVQMARNEGFRDGRASVSSLFSRGR